MHPDNSIKYSPALGPHLSKPYSKESFYTDTSKYKEYSKDNENKLNDKELIMLEFSPGYEKSGECQVQLVPLTLYKPKVHPAKDRPLTNFHISRPVI